MCSKWLSEKQKKMRKWIPFSYPMTSLNCPAFIMSLVSLFIRNFVGSRLLNLVEEIARKRNLNGVSLIAFKQNKAAVRLYEKTGYKTIDRRAVVPHDYINYTGDTLLMVSVN